jgi:phosphate transport system substrate-binding protein
MRTIIVCLLILLLAACSNKKAPPPVADSAPSITFIYDAKKHFPIAPNAYYKVEEDDISGLYISYGWRYPPEENRAMAVTKDEKGLSLFPIVVFDVSASSELRGYPAENLINGSWRSWAEGAAGNGIGQSFTLTWNERGSDDAKTAAGFALKNGYGDINHYNQNNRVKSFKIYADGKYIETIPVKDSIRFEQYIFKKPVTFNALRFVIDDVYPGTRFNDTCVAEIALIQQPVNEERFHEDILFSFDFRDHGSGFYSDYNRAYDDNLNRFIVSVSDPDKLLLLDYLPFVDNLYYIYYDGVRGDPLETKIALLGEDSSLRLSGNGDGNARSDLPRLDGATAMYPLYSSFVRAVYPKIDFDEEYKSHTHALYRWAYYPTTDLLYDRDESDGIGDEEFGSIVQCNKTSRAFQRLIDGETDIIFCYEPSEAERSAAAAKGKQFTLTPIAYDAFVFIVNEKNSLINISQWQIRDIYSGRTTNWKDINGIDEPVIAYQRPENSGSQTILQSIMRGDQLMRTVLDVEYIPRGMFGMIQKITSDYQNYNSAIGYTFLFYLTQMAGSSGVKALALDGTIPTRLAIQNKTYPFTQTVYAITTGNESENTKKFIEWILSAQGQELVEKTGYTPVR